MRFTKGHGTGNDFVILPDPDDALDLTPSLVAAICDRRRGLGADGVLRVVREGSGWFMDYRNADGSLAEMCGNGARVFVRYLIESGLVADSRFEFGSRAGVVRTVVGDEISVALSRPRFNGQSQARIRDLTLTGTAVDVGNPHLVCRVPDVWAVDLREAPQFDAAHFPAGVNVELVDGDVHGARMRVYERGSGETLSCGTGACAVAAVLLGGVTGTVPIEVPGGHVRVTIEDDCCWLAGPAVLVASGELDLAAAQR
jgi:diaminopimelate epimerase